MTGCKLMINDLCVSKNHLKTDIAVLCDYDAPMPKIRAVFDFNGQIRRLPMLIKGSFRRKENHTCIHICSYTYLLDKVFLNEADETTFSMTFEVSFGDEVAECPVVYSCGLVEKYGISPEYAAQSEFDGAMVFTSPFYSDDEDNNADFVYSCEPDAPNGGVLIKCNVNYEKDEPNKLLAFLSSFAKTIVLLFTCIYGILMIPLFVLDGFFAGVGLVSKHKYMPTANVFGEIVGQIKTNIVSYFRCMLKSRKKALRVAKLSGNKYIREYAKLCDKPVVQNRVSFISGRRDELGGNEKFVYDLIKDNPDIDFQFLMYADFATLTKPKNLRRFYELYATSKVVIVDDYLSLLNTVDKRDDVTLFQLWHACGAFKTFGFSRLGKTGGPKQTSIDHRMYDRTIVSSEGIVKYYAEGFGIDDKKVLPTGIPRTDIFFDEKYAENIRKNFFERFPAFKGKKIILFAPTFRGNGQKGAYYPKAAFDPCRFIEDVGSDYVMILKLHPFCRERYEIDVKHSDRIIDLSDDDELNDLLFVTDLLITDYSSSVFEASLLNIPMLFYAYDLYQYITDRDFYCDFENFVPGKIVFTNGELVESVRAGDFEQEKVEPFKYKFFTNPDGKASQRVADAILSVLKS